MKRHLTIFAALAALIGAPVAAQAQDSAAPPDVHRLRFCTGSKSGNYHFAAETIAAHLGRAVFPQGGTFIASEGSLSNLRKLAAGECDVAFTQADVLQQYVQEHPGTTGFSPFKTLYTEYVQVLCPAASGWSSIQDLGKHHATLIVGPDGSGTAETWRSLRMVNDKLYGGISLNPDPPDIGSVLSLKDSKDTCMLWVSGLDSPDMHAANERSPDPQSGKPTLQLISVDDRKMTKIAGPNGQPLYTVKTISPVKAKPGKPGFYDHLINNGGLLSSAGVDVLTVPAVLVIRDDYRRALPRDVSNRLALAIEDSMPALRKRVNPEGE